MSTVPDTAPIFLNVEITEEGARMATLTVCDPLYKLTAEEAAEVLKALGLMLDPLHKEMASYYGSRRKG